MKLVLGLLGVLAATISSGFDDRAWSTVQRDPLIRIAFHPQMSGEQDPLKELFIEELKKITHLNIKAIIPENYASVGEGMTKGQVDFAFLSGFSYILAADKVQLTVLLKTIFDGEEMYRAAIVVKKGRGFRTLEDLKGKTLSFGDRQSTSGYLLPYAALLGKGIVPEKFFKSIQYSGQHKESLHLLLEEKVDAVATWAKLKVAEGSWNLFLAPEQQSQVEPLLFTEAVPNEIFCVTSDFSKKYPRETMKVVAALLSYINMPENRNLIDQLFRMDYFVPAYNTDFSKLRAMVKRVESKLK